MLKCAFLILFICQILIANDFLRKSESGTKFLQLANLKFNSLLRWRADSSLISDLKNMSRFFGWATIVGFVIVIVCSFINISINPYLALIILINISIWIALKWGTNPYKETLEWFKPLILILLFPLVVYILNVTGQICESEYFFSEMSTYLGLLGVETTTNLITVIYFTMFLMCGVLGISLIWIIQNSIIVMLFLSTLWLSTKLSRVLLRIDKQLYHIIVYFLFIISSAIVCLGSVLQL